MLHARYNKLSAIQSGDHKESREHTPSSVKVRSGPVLQRRAEKRPWDLRLGAGPVLPSAPSICRDQHSCSRGSSLFPHQNIPLLMPDSVNASDHEARRLPLLNVGVGLRLKVCDSVPSKVPRRWWALLTLHSDASNHRAGSGHQAYPTHQASSSMLSTLPLDPGPRYKHSNVQSLKRQMLPSAMVAETRYSYIL